MPGDKIRVGIIGANVNRGWGSSAHIPALQALPEYELTAVCTAHQETAEEAAKKFGARYAFHDHLEMAGHPEIDLVTVAVRVPFHHQLTIDALEAGKHVYTEWPLGATSQEAEEMAALARAKGVRTMVGLQGRATPAFLHLREMIEQGYVGEVLACQVTQSTAQGLDRTSDRLWARSRSSGVGALAIGFAHTIDALCCCVGPLTEVSGIMATQVSRWRVTDLGTEVEVTTPDNVLLAGRLAGGAVLSAHVGYVPWHGAGVAIRIFGREGTLVYQAQPGGPPRVQGGKAGDAALQDLPVPDPLTAVPQGLSQGAAFNVAQMYRRLAEAIRTGKPADPDFDSAVRVHRLLDAIQLASDEGRRVPVA